jgi:hypothetical protein
LEALEVDDAHVGVVAGPSRVGSTSTCGNEVADDVAVGVEQANLGDAEFPQMFLASCFTQEVFWLEQGGRPVVLVEEDLWRRVLLTVFFAVSNRAAATRHRVVASSCAWTRMLVA